MRAWLERRNPGGADIPLPEGRATLVFGRGARSTIVFDDAKAGERHCEVSFDGTFWRLKDLGSGLGTQVNGVTATHAWPLFDGDEIGFAGVRLGFRDDLPDDDPALIAAITANPDREEPWLVFADALQDVGDPLGERIVKSRTGEAPDHLPWLGPLWDPFVAGALEIEWQLGFIKRATVRSVAGRPAVDWPSVVTTLCCLRIGRFIRELVIDVPRLEAAATEGQCVGAVGRAQETLLALSALPQTLTRLTLGMQVGAIRRPGDWAQAKAELALRLPRLTSKTVYRAGGLGVLRPLTLDAGTRLVGLLEGRKPLTGVVRLRRGTSRGVLHLEEPPGMPFLHDGNPCYLSLNQGHHELMAGRLKGEIDVNGRIAPSWALLPGDVVRVQGIGRFVYDFEEHG